MQNNTWLVMAQYYTSKPERTPFEGEFPRVMGFYEAPNPEAAFRMFLEEYVKDPRHAQIFYDQVTVIPCISKFGVEFKLSDVYGQLMRFPNPDVVDEIRK